MCADLCEPLEGTCFLRAHLEDLLKRIGTIDTINPDDPEQQALAVESKNLANLGCRAHAIASALNDTSLE